MINNSGLPNPTAAPHYSKSFAPVVGIGITLPLQNRMKGFFFYPEVKFTSYKTTGVFADEYKTVTTSFRSELIIVPRISFGINVVNHPKLNWNIAAGLGALILIQQKQNETITYQTGTTIVSKNSLANSSMPWSGQSALTFNKKYQVWMEYTLKTQIFDQAYDTGKLEWFAAGLGYRF